MSPRVSGRVREWLRKPATRQTELVCWGAFVCFVLALAAVLERL